MAFNQQEQEIIKWGLSNGKSKDQVQQAITNFRTGYIPPKPEVKEPGYIDRLKGDFQERKEEVKDINSSNVSLSEKILQNAGQIAGGATDIVTELPGVKQGLELAGKVITKVPGVEKAGEVYNKLPERARDNIEAVGNIASIIPVGVGVKGGMAAAEKAAQAATKAAKASAKVVKPLATKVGKQIIPDSSNIMNRVARLKPTDATKFEKLAGKTHGEYLVESKNFGTPDQIINKEATKFAESIKASDEGLDKLPGVYRDGSITDALNGLLEKARNTSGDNIKSPYLKQVESLMAKHEAEGLTMKETNIVKRLYEKNVKLGYNKMVNGDKVEQATNIDNALREWQVSKADELGFTDLSNIRKQTQLSKFLIDKLGEQLVGQAGLNGVSLTDWIMLSGGNPTAVAGFLTKKFFSSKTVQSKIAEILDKGKTKVTRAKQTKPQSPKK